MTHPLTNEICEEIAEDVLYYDYSIPTFRFDMRSAANWQLEQVNAWIDKNVHNYIDPDNLWTCEILYKLQEDLNKAMRPTTTQEDN